jgi:hypothetical protein
MKILEKLNKPKLPKINSTKTIWAKNKIKPVSAEAHNPLTLKEFLTRITEFMPTAKFIRTKPNINLLSQKI